MKRAGCFLQMLWIELSDRNPELRELKFFIMDHEHAGSLFCREILSLSSNTVYYTNILENIVQNRCSLGLCS